MVKPTIYSAVAGMNSNSIPSQMGKGELSYALNAVVKGFDGTSITYQTENGNELFFMLPAGTQLIGRHSIIERDLIVLFLAGNDQIGVLSTKTGVYTPVIAWSCLNFDLKHPIQKVVHKITTLGVEIYWTDRHNTMRYLNLDNPPSTVDCNLIRLMPAYKPVTLEYTGDGNDGDLISGTYQFGFQYASATGEPFTEYSTITNPISLHNPFVVTSNFDNPTGKSISLEIKGIDTTGIFEYYNVGVAKTINNITSFELVGTFRITKETERFTYTGQTKTDIRLTADDFFESFARYEKAGDVTRAKDILIWSDLITPERVNYQEIFSKIPLKWCAYRLPYQKGDNYKLPLNTANRKGYFRDEVYAIEGVLEFNDGSVSDRCSFIGRPARASDLVTVSNKDAVGLSETACEAPAGGKVRWQVYNTATSYGLAPEYLQNVGDACYNGVYQTGEFGYHESSETYPASELWGELAGQPIRHFRFPDATLTHHHDSNGNIYPLGVSLDLNDVRAAIEASSLTAEQKARIVGIKILRGNRANNKSVVARGLLYNVGKYTRDNRDIFYPNYVYNDVREDILISRAQTGDDSGDNSGLRLNGFGSSESKQRFTFHSPDTHFYQPFLGNQLKLESIEYGDVTQQIVPVKAHSRYKVLSRGSYATSLGVAVLVAAAGGMYGVSTQPFDWTAGFTAFTAFMAIIEKTIPRVNYAYQLNSVGNYTKSEVIPNEGNKIRFADIASYLVPGMTTAGDTHPINNYQRESSVYIRTTDTLPFVHEAGGPQDTSRNLPTATDATTGVASTYYASIKRSIINQYGRIFSYEAVDTGARFDLTTQGIQHIFGGDCFITPFALKRKMPFFTDHRVGFPDEADIDYPEVPNVGFPTYWFSTDAASEGASGFVAKVAGVKVNNFYDEKQKFFYQYGKFFVFIYGINNFFCESEVNVEYRQATNNKEGDFFPHVGSDIPNEWLQYVNVPIEQDNTYTYNKSYSKQNKEKFFSVLPEDFNALRDAIRELPNSAFYSEPQIDSTIYRRNNWRIYRPLSIQHFPLTHGKLTSLEGIEDQVVLARFESKSLLYNSLIKFDTSNPKAAYAGNDKLFEAPAIDLGDSDTGYAGSQHKFFLNTEVGKIWVDAKRAQIIWLQGNQPEDLASEKYKMNGFFGANLPFKISDYFDVDIDNNFAGIGLHGVYDTSLSRFILTKLDYEPVSTGITYENGNFYKDGKLVSLQSEHFKSRSFSISFSFLTGSWISYHSYLPISYLNNQSNVYSIRTNSIWKHTDQNYISFYGEQGIYSLEYPIKSNSYLDDILASVSDYSKVYQRNGQHEFQNNTLFFNKAVLYNDEQSSGLLKLIPKDKNRLSQSYIYPKFQPTQTEILVSKVDNTYQYNSFWDLLRDSTLPFLEEETIPFYKEPIDSNHLYGKNVFKKTPLRGKDFKVRQILDDHTDIRIISQFLITEQQPSIK